MALHSEIPSWAPKVSKARIKRLYTSDAQSMIDEGLLDEVGWGLWSRCDSILTVTAAHYGRVICPACGAIIQHAPADSNLPGERTMAWNDADILQCGNCDWRLPWKTYHQTYRGKQLFGANAIEVFEVYHKAFSQAAAARAKMLLIDQLIHAFHTGLTELGRPVGANLIEGSMKEVVLFLDQLTSGPQSGAGIAGSRDDWRRKMENISWAHLFLNRNEDGQADPVE